VSAPDPRLPDRAALRAIVRRLAGEIGADHPDGLVLIGLLKGSICLLADLVRDLDVDCTIDFLALSAYRPGASRIKIMKDIDIDVTQRPVVLVKDVVDSGLSTNYARDLVAARGAGAVRVCTLIDRPQRRILPMQPDYVGISAGEEFLVGYGLDIGEQYRNLDSLFAVNPAEIAVDREPFEHAAYGRAAGVADLGSG
jgi:hypoxanthine phosphoribosyltransferase